MKCIRHKRYNSALLEGIEYPNSHFSNHREVFRKLIGKRPYTITVLIENLDPKLWRRKDYCRQTRIEIPSRYIEFLHKAFYTDFGKESAEKNYGEWLNKYRSLWLRERKTDNLDDYIIWNELEPRYKEKILKRFSNRKELFKPRYRIEPERFYHLPLPLPEFDIGSNYNISREEEQRVLKDTRTFRWEISQEPIERKT